MTIESMTGFARAAGSAGSLAWSWEIRSVNGRGLDVRVRVPPGFESVADIARKRLNGAFARGTLHVNLTVSNDVAPPRPRINEAALAALIEAVARLPVEAAIRPASYDGLLNMRGIVEFADDTRELTEDVTQSLLTSFDAAIEALKQARLDEGKALAHVVGGQSEAIAELTRQAESHPARSVDAIRARLAAQVAALMGAGSALDAQRLHQEAALLAVKADIREELDRLHAHVAALRQLLSQGGPIGRKLDFLSQEFGREASTLCAKAGDAGLSSIGMDLRTVIDQMREQVQNVE